MLFGKTALGSIMSSLLLSYQVYYKLTATLLAVNCHVRPLNKRYDNYHTYIYPREVFYGYFVQTIDKAYKGKTSCKLIPFIALTHQYTFFFMPFLQ